MGIRLVVFDLDDTLWESSHGVCSRLEPPLRRAGPDEIVDSAGERLRLKPEARSVLETLRRRGLLLSAASLNDETAAGDVLRLLDLDGLFSYPLFRRQPKDLSLKTILDLLRLRAGIRVSIDEVLFVDDQSDHVRMARDLGARALQMGRDIRSLTEILPRLENGT